MAAALVGLIALAAPGLASAEVLKVGGVYNTGIGLRGKAAFDLWAAWANGTSNKQGFTVEMTWHAYSDDAALAASVAKFVSDGMHVIIPPYSSGLTKKAVDAVPAGSSIPILAWGGASDSIFTENCVNRSCFGGFTVASKYISPSLARVKAAAGGALKVGMVTNSNGFSASVKAGAASFVAETAGIDVAANADVTLSAYKTELTQEDVDKVGKVISAAPDVVVVIGHPGDVEKVVSKVRSDASYQPKAVIAVNGLSTPSNYADQKHMDGVIMPEQWDEASAADSIVGWTPAAFKQALGDNASYHSASAGGLAVALTHAIAAGKAGERMSTIAEKMAAAGPLQTFYGSLSWKEGVVQKPMFGKQRQGEKEVIVAPEGSIVYPLPSTTLMSTETSSAASMGLTGVLGACLSIFALV